MTTRGTVSVKKSAAVGRYQISDPKLEILDDVKVREVLTYVDDYYGNTNGQRFITRFTPGTTQYYLSYIYASKYDPEPLKGMTYMDSVIARINRELRLIIKSRNLAQLSIISYYLMEYSSPHYTIALTNLLGANYVIFPKTIYLNDTYAGYDAKKETFESLSAHQQEVYDGQANKYFRDRNAKRLTILEMTKKSDIEDIRLLNYVGDLDPNTVRAILKTGSEECTRIYIADLLRIALRGYLISLIPVEDRDKYNTIHDWITQIVVLAQGGAGLAMTGKFIGVDKLIVIKTPIPVHGDSDSDSDGSTPRNYSPKSIYGEDPIKEAILEGDDVTDEFIHEAIIGKMLSRLAFRGIRNFSILYDFFYCGEVEKIGITANGKEGVSICEGSNSLPYLVYEYIDGLSLKDYVFRQFRDRWPIEPDVVEGRILNIVLQIALAFREASIYYTIHGDLHGNNVIIKTYDNEETIHYTGYDLTTNISPVIIDYGRTSMAFGGNTITPPVYFYDMFDYQPAAELFTVLANIYAMSYAATGDHVDFMFGLMNVFFKVNYTFMNGVIKSDYKFASPSPIFDGASWQNVLDQLLLRYEFSILRATNDPGSFKLPKCDYLDQLREVNKDIDTDTKNRDLEIAYLELLRDNSITQEERDIIDEKFEEIKSKRSSISLASPISQVVSPLTDAMQDLSVRSPAPASPVYYDTNPNEPYPF